MEKWTENDGITGKCDLKNADMERSDNYRKNETTKWVIPFSFDGIGGLVMNLQYKYYVDKWIKNE